MAIHALGENLRGITNNLNTERMTCQSEGCGRTKSEMRRGSENDGVPGFDGALNSAHDAASVKAKG
jgi:hypothetical protein